MADRKNSVASINDDDYTVSDRGEILRLLKGLQRNRVMLSAAFNAGKDFLLTSVLNVDAEDNAILLDVHANETSNRQLLRSQRTIFHSFHNGVKIQWVSTEVESGTFDGSPAFRVEIPEQLQRVQRRGFHRVTTPIVNPLVCHAYLAEEQVIDLTLIDICAEGIGVILPVDSKIEKGTELPDCRLDLPEIGPVHLAAFVRSVWDHQLKNGGVSHRAGLEFVNIHPTTQAKVQRYINKLERSRITATVTR